MAAVEAFARADKIGETVSKYFGLSLYDFAKVMTISVPEWQTTSIKLRHQQNTPLATVRPPVMPTYVEKVREMGMNREGTEPVWTRHDAEGINLDGISSVAEQHAFVQNLDRDRVSDVRDCLKDENNHLVSEDTVAGKKATASDVRVILQQIKCFCEEGGGPRPTIAFEVIDLVIYGIETSCKNT